MKKYYLIIFLILPSILNSQTFVPDAPELNVKSYILIEPNTNTIIAQYNPDLAIEPASMTKIMTSYVVADQIDNNLMSMDDQVVISEKAWRMQGSKMFIEAGKKVSILDLLKGIIVQSGNDASVAIAEFAGGSESGFVDLMNSYASSLSMNNTNFTNSSGLPDKNHFSSANDLAILTSNFINKFPDIYKLYSEKSYTFNDIRQLNRNKLLWQDDSSDGVKTGHTESAGYCLVGSAKRGKMRLITVIAGSTSDKARFSDSRRLLEYGFRYYVTQKVLTKDEPLNEVTVWGGKKNSVNIGVNEDVLVTIARPEFNKIKYKYNYTDNIEAPINAGDVLGSIDIINPDNTYITKELVALEDVKAKGFLGRIWSKFVLWLMGLFGLR
jgi:D-alanyl-D-alanine carboxypeptidase (penicillin-binding protein 5/6)